MARSWGLGKPRLLSCSLHLVKADEGADEAAAMAAVASAEGRRQGTSTPNAGAGPEPAAACARRASGRVRATPDRWRAGHVLFAMPLGQGEEEMSGAEDWPSPSTSPDRFDETSVFLNAFDAD